MNRVGPPGSFVTRLCLCAYLFAAAPRGHARGRVSHITVAWRGVRCTLYSPHVTPLDSTLFCTAQLWCLGRGRGTGVISAELRAALARGGEGR